MNVNNHYSNFYSILISYRGGRVMNAEEQLKTAINVANVLNTHILIVGVVSSRAKRIKYIVI